jgi:hypothetical protein
MATITMDTIQDTGHTTLDTLIIAIIIPIAKDAVSLIPFSYLHGQDSMLTQVQWPRR